MTVWGKKSVRLKNMAEEVCLEDYEIFFEIDCFSLLSWNVACLVFVITYYSSTFKVIKHKLKTREKQTNKQYCKRFPCFRHIIWTTTEISSEET